MTLLFLGNLCFGQTNLRFPDTLKYKESFIYLTDTVIRKEISSFNIKGLSISKTNSLFKSKMIEIPLKKCTDSSAYFEKGNLYASEIIVYIDSENGISKSRIKEVMYIHYKYGIILPDSAISGLYEPNFCSKIRDSKKEITSNCKVFRSEDRRRVYIYMLNGDGNSRYEVTWIIKDGEYLTRIIDKVN